MELRVEQKDTKRIFGEFDDIVEARHLMRKLEHVLLIRNSDGAILSIKNGNQREGGPSRPIRLPGITDI